MAKKMKFGNTIDFAKNTVKIAILVIVGIVLFIIVKAVLHFAKNPAKSIIDFFDNFLDEALSGLRACGTCTPSDNQKKQDPTLKNICGGTGIPFLNGRCLGGIIVLVILTAFLLGGIRRAYNYFSGNRNEKLSDTYKRTSGKSYKEFKDQLDEEEKEADKEFEDAYEKWNNDKGGDTLENRKAFEKATAENFRKGSNVPEKLKNVSDEDLIKMIKSEKVNSAMRTFTSGAAKSGGSDPAAIAKSKAASRTAALKDINKSVSEEDAAEELTEEEFDRVADDAIDFKFAV